MSEDNCHEKLVTGDYSGFKMNIAEITARTLVKQKSAPRTFVNQLETGKIGSELDGATLTLGQTITWTCSNEYLS